MTTDESETVITNAQLEQLELESVIGISGKVPNGLILHNDDQRILYPLGSTVVIKNLIQNTQEFINAGDQETKISYMALNKEGNLMVTGQTTHTGFPVMLPTIFFLIKFFYLHYASNNSFSVLLFLFNLN